jgi:hypothetical protein
MVYLLVFILQILFNICKTLEIKLTYENKISLLLWNSVFINLISLTSTYFSIQGLLKGNFFIGGLYILGSVLGKWFSMKYYDNYRSMIYEFFKRKK